ncbi:MAG: SDR family oxidoreductase [Clostridia bacterium]|nr:SDR family oxidoreductase [Clostridia bacterium]
MKALVTGASSGIGYDIAKYLSKLGYDIIAVARNEEALNRLKTECSTNVEIILSDLSVYENLAKLYMQVSDQEIDLLVNNAGFGLFGEFHTLDIDKERKMIDTNITAVDVLTKLFLKDMIKKDSGKILNVASIAGFMPGPLMSSYYATKAYVVRLSQAIYQELKIRKSNVSISILCPGPVNTNFNNVAGVHFNIKPLTSEYVAKYAIDKTLKNKNVIVPGLLNKIVRFLSKVTPDKLLMYFAYKAQAKKME